MAKSMFFFSFLALLVFGQRGERPKLVDGYLGDISVSMDGEDVLLSVLGGGNVTPIGNKVTLAFNSRILLGKPGAKDFSPESYQQIKLEDLTIKWTVDMKAATCSCNSAIYMVAMPGKNADGSYAPSDDGTYYCDANDITGIWCPEMDLAEANQYSVQITPHKCTGKNGGAWSHCDTGGCATNIVDIGLSRDYGPGRKLDTNREYTQEVVFNGDLITANFYQDGGQKLSFPVCNDHTQTHQMIEQSPDGQVIAISFWGADDMSWLNHGSCSGSCGTDPNRFVTYRDIEITHGEPGPTPKPSPGPSRKGCCSWSGCKQCDETGVFCQNEEHCTGTCEGQWCDPAPTGFMQELEPEVKRVKV